MPRLRRQPIEFTDDWSQLDLLVGSLEQRLYEMHRPVGLRAFPPLEGVQ